MQTIIRHVDKDPHSMAALCKVRRKGTFQSRELRDAVYKDLKFQGFKVRKRMTTGQNLHPEYVDDYEGRLEIGFGNTQYQTYWAKLYLIEFN